MLKRGKQKIPTHFGMPEYYKEYKKQTKNPIDAKLFSEIHKEINDEVFKLMREQNFMYQLPCRLGKLRIKKYKAKVEVFEDGSFQWENLKIDYKKTREYWFSKYPGLSYEEILAIPDKARIYHMNQHTQGYRYRYFWDKSTAIFAGKSTLSFKPVRAHSRELASWLKSINSINIDYFE